MTISLNFSLEHALWLIGGAALTAIALWFVRKYELRKVLDDRRFLNRDW